MLNFLSITLLSNAQKSNQLCSILCSQLLLAIMSQFIYNFNDYILAQFSSILLCFNFYLLCHAPVLLYLVYYTQMRKLIPHFVPSWHDYYTIGCLFLRATNFANRLKSKFEETVFTNLHWCLLFSLQSMS